MLSNTSTLDTVNPNSVGEILNLFIVFGLQIICFGPHSLPVSLTEYIVSLSGNLAVNDSPRFNLAISLFLSS